MTHRWNEHNPTQSSVHMMFSGKFQLAHFVLFKNVRLCRSYSTVQINFVKSLGKTCLDIWMLRLALALLEIAVAVTNWSFFDLLPLHLSSLAVVFLSLTGGFLVSCDPVSSSFLKILWITLLDFPTVFEISPIKSLSSLHNLSISFLSSNDVTDNFVMLTMQESLKSQCNLVKYPVLYCYPKSFLIIQKNY